MNLIEYWSDTSRIKSSPQHEIVDELLVGVLRGLGPIKDVLDVGCGVGRTARLLREALPEATYYGLDSGERQVQLCSEYGKVYHSSIQAFAPRRKWDLVIASELLMHIPPDDIRRVCGKLKRLARLHVVTVDWSEPIERPTAPWNWLHDYASLFGSVVRQEQVGYQSIFVIEP